MKLGLDQLIVACKNEKIMSEIGVEVGNKLETERINRIEFKTVEMFLEGRNSK